MQRTYRPDLGIMLVPLQSGRYYRFPNGGATSTLLSTAGTMLASPKFIPAAVTLDRLGAEVSTIGDVGSKVRLGIYADDGTMRPGALVLDAGTINGDSATAQTITISQTLNRGWYWFAMVSQVVTTTSPTWRTLSIPSEPIAIDVGSSAPTNGCLSYSVAGVTGALPATFGAPTRAVNCIALFGRVA